MKIFLDSANLDEINEIHDLNIIEGLTTNPSLIAKNAKNLTNLIKEICDLVDGDVSFEVAAKNSKDMIEEGIRIKDLSEKIVIKLPMTWDGISACRYFRDKDIKVNMTLCFSAAQALIAAKAGASYVSPFIGRVDDASSNGIKLIEDIKKIYSNYPEIKTQILAASIRHLNHFHDAALVGCDAITMPGALIKKLVDHPLTDQGLKIFDQDWKNSGLKI